MRSKVDCQCLPTCIIGTVGIVGLDKNPRLFDEMVLNVDGVYFVGSAYQASNGKAEMRRMRLRRIGDGRLRHTGTASSDDGVTWIVKYDLIYVPRGEKFELEDLSI